MCRPKTKSTLWLIAAAVAAVALDTTLSGCSDLYLDRRDAISLSAGDAIAGNEMSQMIDPWPAHSGDTNLAFNGQRMQAAIERYRLGKVTGVEDSQQMSSASSSQPQNVTQVSVGGGSSSPSTGTTSTPGGSSTSTSTASSGQ
jgi:hypothetical protein